jgi:hypothetical protein
MNSMVSVPMTVLKPCAKGTIPYVTIRSSQEGVDGLLDALLVVYMADMMMKGGDGLRVLQ